MKVLAKRCDILDLHESFFGLSLKDFKVHEIYFKAFVVSVDEAWPRTANCIFIDEPVTEDMLADDYIPKERQFKEDEREHSSRKDTLWGDAKLLAKKISRDIEHDIGETKKKREQTAEKFINLRIYLPTETPKIEPGYHFFRLTRPMGTSLIGFLAGLANRKENMTTDATLAFDPGEEAISTFSFLQIIKKHKKIRLTAKTAIFASLLFTVIHFSNGMKEIRVNKIKLNQVEEEVGRKVASRHEKLLNDDLKMIRDYIETMGHNPIGVFQVAARVEQEGNRLELKIKDYSLVDNNKASAKAFLQDLCDQWLGLRNKNFSVYILEEYKYNQELPGVRKKFQQTSYSEKSYCKRSGGIFIL